MEVGGGGSIEVRRENTDTANPKSSNWQARERLLGTE